MFIENILHIASFAEKEALYLGSLSHINRVGAMMDKTYRFLSFKGVFLFSFLVCFWGISNLVFSAEGNPPNPIGIIASTIEDDKRTPQAFVEQTRKLAQSAEDKKKIIDQKKRDGKPLKDSDEFAPGEKEALDLKEKLEEEGKWDNDKEIEKLWTPNDPKQNPGFSSEGRPAAAPITETGTITGDDLIGPYAEPVQTGPGTFAEQVNEEAKAWNDVYASPTSETPAAATPPPNSFEEQVAAEAKAWNDVYAPPPNRMANLSDATGGVVNDGLPGGDAARRAYADAQGYQDHPGTLYNNASNSSTTPAATPESVERPKMQWGKTGETPVSVGVGNSTEEQPGLLSRMYDGAKDAWNRVFSPDPNASPMTVNPMTGEYLGAPAGQPLSDAAFAAGDWLYSRAYLYPLKNDELGMGDQIGPIAGIGDPTYPTPDAQPVPTTVGKILYDGNGLNPFVPPAKALGNLIFGPDGNPMAFPGEKDQMWEDNPGLAWWRDVGMAASGALPFASKAVSSFDDVASGWGKAAAAGEGAALESGVARTAAGTGEGTVARVATRSDDAQTGLRYVSGDEIAGTANKNNIVYRALNDKDMESLSRGYGLEGKAPNGIWSAEEHIVNGSQKGAWKADPWISTTRDIDIARSYVGDGRPIAVIDLNKVPQTQLEVWKYAPRYNQLSVDGINFAYRELEVLPYYRSFFAKEVTIKNSIPREALIGIIK